MKTKQFRQSGIVLLCTIGFLSLTGCFNKEGDSPNPNENDVDYSVLDFSSQREISINLSYDAGKGYASFFELYDEYPLTKAENGSLVLKNGLKPVSGGMATSGKFQQSRIIPSYVKELYAYSADMFSPLLMRADVTGNSAVFTEVDLGTKSSNRVSTRNDYDPQIHFYLGQYGDKIDIVGNGKPNYTFYDDAFINNGLAQNRISQTFKERVKIVGTDAEQYLQDALLKVEEKTKISVGIVHSVCEYESSLSYFYFEGDENNTPDLSQYSVDDVKEIMAFPRAKVNGASIDLQKGDYIDLKYYDKNKDEWVDEFPKNTIIGFILRADGYNLANGSLQEPEHTYYSYNVWNPESDPEKRRHTIFFDAGKDPNALPSESGTYADGESIICFGFEDQNIETKSDWDCNDLIFHVKGSITPPPPLPEYGHYEHSYTREGLLLFEDKWPQIADYDFNDAVIGYKSTITCDIPTTEGELTPPDIVKWIEEEITLLQTTAAFNNKFAYKLEFDPGRITLIQIDGKTIPLDHDMMTEYSKMGAIIHLSNGLIDDIGDGRLGACKPITIKLRINIWHNIVTDKETGEYKMTGTPYDKLKNDLAPYNPYIWYDKGREVHLTNYRPTSQAKTALFFDDGNDDYSDPDAGLFYIGPSNQPYPFALNLPIAHESFKIPAEGQNIMDVYSDYLNWVKEGANSNADNKYSGWFKQYAND